MNNEQRVVAMYLITGGAGFIGSHIVEKLLSMGKTVRVLDNFSTGKRENLKEWADKIELIEGDIRDINTVKKALKGVHFCIHQAAIPSVARSLKDPVGTTEVNIRGTLSILYEAKNAGVKKVVYASSSSVYGDSKELPQKETQLPNPLSPYALTKLTGEHYCRISHNAFSLPVAALRFFNVFGERQDAMSDYSAVIPRFIHALLSGKSPVIYGDGEQSRDFTYVSNVVDAVLASCERSEADGEVFNIACGRDTTVNKLLSILQKITGFNTKPVYMEQRAGETKRSLADIAKAKQLLGFSPKVGLEEGLKKTVQGCIQK